MTKLVETYENGDVETVTFQYSGNKILKRTSDYAFRDETIFTYTGDLITKEEYFFDDDAGYSFYEVINYEYDASNRALAWLKAKNMVTPEEYKGSEDALKWAASTYVVAALGALASLLYWAYRILGSRD